VFGLPVQDRKLHSARSASEEYGITSQTLKKRLRALGVEGRTVAGPNNSIFIFEASSFEDQLREIEEGMTKRVAVKYLGLKPAVGETSLFCRAGSARAFARRKRQQGERLCQIRPRRLCG